MPSWAAWALVSRVIRVKVLLSVSGIPASRMTGMCVPLAPVRGEPG